jgi:hypothetical protein
VGGEDEFGGDDNGVMSAGLGSLSGVSSRDGS